MYQRESHLQKITRFLSQLKTEVELRNSISLLDINIHAEYFYKDLFNLVYDLGLENLNVQTKNVAFIDLIDEKNKIAIQVTSQNDNGKITDTIKGFFDNPENADFELKVLLIAKSAKDYRTDFTFDGKYKFNHKEDVIDIERLLAEIRNKSIEDIAKIAEFLSNEDLNFTAFVPKFIPANFLKVPTYFTGRADVLEDIFDTLHNHQIASLCGIKGIGKTSVTYKFIEESLSTYQHIIFIRADRDNFSVNFENACLELSLVFANDETEQSKIAMFSNKIEELCANLEQDNFVLLIFDNVDEVPQITKFVPSFEKLHTLLTSNFQEIHDIAHRVEINKLSDNEAKLLLYQKSNNVSAENLDDVSAEDQAVMLQIAELLGHHPFALSITGLYIRNKKKTFEQYLNRLQNTQGRILKDEAGVDQYDHPTIYSAFLIPFNDILETKDDSEEEEIISQISLECLKVATLLSADNMPEEVFSETMSLIFPLYSDFIADEDSWDKIYQKLSIYGFFERDPYLKTFSIHRLFQLFLKEELGEETVTVESSLLEILDLNFKKYDFNNKDRIERYLSHITLFLEFLERSNFNEDRTLKIENEASAIMCNHFARYNELSGKYDIAQKYYSISINICESTANIAPILLAGSYNNLGGIYYTLDNYDDAEYLTEKGLIIREKVLGENDWITAQSYNNLASIYHTQGKTDEAEELVKKALEIDKKVLGEYHPNTANDYFNLAICFREKGEFEEAESSFIKVIEIRKKVLGEHHPHLASGYLNLALLYQNQNKNLKEIKSLYEKSLAIREISLGVNHPDTAESYLGLGVFYNKEGNFREALKLFEKALKIYQIALPENHSTIIGCKESIKNIENSIKRIQTP